MSEELTDQAQSAPSENQSFGREAREAVEKAAGYEPLDTGPKDPDPDHTALAHAIGLEPGQVPEPREEEEAPYRPLINPATGVQIEDNQSLTVEQAAQMVSQNQAWENQAKQTTADAEMAIAIDEVQRQAIEHLAGINAYGPQGLDSFMAEQAAQQAKAAENAKAAKLAEAQAVDDVAVDGQPGEPQAQPQAQEPIGEDGLTESTRALLQNPQIRADLEQTYAQVAQAQQAYTQAAAQAVQAASLSLMADVPELNGLNDEQITGALAMMQAQQPDRYAQVIGRLQNLAGVSQQLQAHVAQQQAVAQQQQVVAMHQWGQQQDAQFEEYAKGIPKAEREMIAAEAQKILLEHMDENSARYLWNNSVIRSAAGQAILADAARYRLAKRGATQRARPNVPPVQKPGTQFANMSADSRTVRALEERFNKTGSAKDAAAWFSAKTAARKSGKRTAI